MKKIVFLLLLSTVFLSCVKEENTTISTEVVSINYGTSFGECIGYCNNNITVTDTNVLLEKKGWSNIVTLPEVTETTVVTAAVLQELFEKVDFDAFLNLEEVIGCPDCADGGAEWVEIITEDQSYKVTYEYFNEPEVLKELAAALRELNASLQKDNYVIVDKETYNATETYGYTINDVSIENNNIKITISSSGCDGDSWVVSLVDENDVMESAPPQRSLKVSVINEEACLAFITRTYEFDITKLQVENSNEVLLNIEGWQEKIVYNY